MTGMNTPARDVAVRGVVSFAPAPLPTLPSLLPTSIGLGLTPVTRSSG